MTTEELSRELGNTARLIALLRFASGDQAEDLEDLLWLQRRQRYLASLRAIRAAERGKKVVSLALWRDGIAPPRPRCA